MAAQTVRAMEAGLVPIPAGCRARRNGSTRPVQGPPPRGSGVIPPTRPAAMRTSQTAPRFARAVTPGPITSRMRVPTGTIGWPPWAATARTPGDCMTCWGMPGNGPRTAPMNPTEGHQMTARPGRRAIAASVWCAAVPGTASPASCALPTATGTIPITGTTTPVFAWPVRTGPEPLRSRTRRVRNGASRAGHDEQTALAGGHPSARLGSLWPTRAFLF
jgi:hypothetical protein